MRLHYISLLVVGASLENAKSNIVPTELTLSTAASLTAGKNDVPVLRFIRTSVIAGKDDEDGEQSATVHRDDGERTFSFNSLINVDALKTKVTTLKLGMFGNNPVEYAFRNKLYKILDAGKVGSTKDVAEGLQIALRKSWLSKINDSPLNIYKELEPGSKLDDILTSPNLQVWTRYLDQYNAAHPDRKMDEIEVLLDSYDEKDVFEMLEAAKEVEGTKKLATKLQMQQRKYWVKNNYSPKEVFRVVEHGRKLDDILTSPYWPVWTRYLDEYNTANSGHEMDEITVLLGSFDQKAVFGMLEAAKEAEGTQKLATKLQGLVGDGVLPS
ncbi:unnamed protein product [Peronospora farinosa]|uniref:RxLR effector protein n=1 Tax=Peronospora farinosa TaxID=134698 RepID=A0ABN8C1X2_9STRA|nr:unnamed protein product [Peronospora farinosa]